MPATTGYVRHFIACNRHDLSRFAPFFIDGKHYGFVARDLAALLPAATGLFEAVADGIALSPALKNFDGRSRALLRATRWIAKHYDKNLRDEMYGVVGAWGDEPVAQIDRAAVPWFGVRAWGVHVNGFVRQPDGIYLWVGERAADRPADPGKLDNLIGGGQPIGLTLEQNLCKEAQEEAGIETALALTATLARTLDYQVERHDGLRRDSLFVYDLELSPDFTPRNTDGEVAAFRLLPLSEVAALVRDTDRFKFNCALVIIDFMARHGFITAQDSEYAALMPWLAAQQA